MQCLRLPGAPRAALPAALLLVLLVCVSAAKPAQGQKNTATVAIVGAGIAGIRAATILQAANVSYVVLEADSIIGGRMRNTEIKPVAGVTLPKKEYVELGANWLQGLAGNPVYDLYMTCRFNGFQMNGTLQNWDSVVTFDQFGKIMANKDIPWKQFSNAQACAASTVATAINANNYNDVDVRAALRVCGWNPVSPIDYAVEWWSINFEWAETAEMVGTARTQPTQAYVDFYDADIFLHDQNPGGLGQLVTCLQQRGNVPSSAIKLNNRVLSFAITSANKVDVKTSAGTTWTVDYVINTMPIAHLQRNIDTLFAAGLWPAAKRAALMQWRMATYTKVFLKFETQFWDPTVQFVLQAPDEGSSNMILWQSLSPNTGGFLAGSNIIMMTLTDTLSAAMEPLPDEVILAKVVARLQQAYPAANTTSKLVGYVIPKWYTNDLFGGSYTNYPAGFNDAAWATLVAPVGTAGDLTTPGKVLFSGEAACRRLNGYMPGGYAAGERSANQILKALGKFSGDPDQNICERQLTKNGKPLGTKARGSGNAA